MSRAITPHFEQLIDRFIAGDRFNNKSGVIRSGLRLLEEHEAKAAIASRKDLTRVIQTALAADPGGRSPSPALAPMKALPVLHEFLTRQGLRAAG